MNTQEQLREAFNDLDRGTFLNRAEIVPSLWLG